MEWDNLYSETRTGTATITEDARSEYQRDFDRLIFSSGFRRLQNKTQVFPLPGVAFVHNRLTHSLEVASVGRSLGKIIGKHIADNFRISDKSKDFYINELHNVTAAACLAHDIGNPPFGHSGEKALSRYFQENATLPIENGEELRHYFDQKYWSDLINFEGNANGFRFLTHKFNGKIPGGLRLTHTTLAATLKYPCESSYSNDSYLHRKKYNCFQSEKATFQEVCSKTNMDKESDNPMGYKRHPFVFLTEAADDICYNIIDFEDAQRLGILNKDVVEKYLRDLLKCISIELGVYDFERAYTNAEAIEDTNDKISYYRAKCINALIMICVSRFEDHSVEILNGSFNEDLFGFFKSKCSEMKRIKEISENNIYNHKSVVKIELVGYKVLYDLLHLFVPAILKKYPTSRDKKILELIPSQFKVDEFNDSAYSKVISILDFISGMTDTYAIQLYRDLFGIEIAKHE